MAQPFLTARWEHLVLLNYHCPEDLLEPLVPVGTVLDRWNGETLVSLVGFRFVDTRVRGFSIPFHRTFLEVNLRFYVRRLDRSGESRRAVVFIRELVPRRAIAALARWMYNEPYLAVPMSDSQTLDPHEGGRVEYRWQHQGTDYRLAAAAVGRAGSLRAGSEAEFITEHYWGYTRQRDGRTLEYQVEHPRWAVWEATEAHFEGGGERLYGSRFANVLATKPRSAFIALGSDVAVHHGRIISP